MTKITVLLPVYNAARFLPETLASLRAQTLADFKILAINDGSTDESGAILDSYASQESRLQVVHQENQGFAKTLAWGVKQCKTPLIVRLDADDLALPQRFEKQYAAFQSAREKLAVLGSGFHVINTTGRAIETVKPPTMHDDITNQLWRGRSVIAHPSVMMRRDAVLAVGNYRKPFDHAEDFDLWIRISQNYALANLPEPLIRYRRHQNNVSTVNAKIQFYSTALALWDALRHRAYDNSETLPPLPQEITKDSLRSLGFSVQALSCLDALALLRQGKSSLLQKKWVAALRCALRLGAMPYSTVKALRGGVLGCVPPPQE